MKCSWNKLKMPGPGTHAEARAVRRDAAHLALVCAFVQCVQCVQCVQAAAAGQAQSPFSKDAAEQQYIVLDAAGQCRDAQEWFGRADGPAASALFDEPSAAISVAAAAAPDGVLVADRRDGLIRRVAAGRVESISGSSFGYADGNRAPGSPAHSLARCRGLRASHRADN